MYAIFFFIEIILFIQINESKTDHIRLWFDQALILNEIQLSEKEKHNFLTHMKDVIKLRKLRRDFDKKFQLDLAIKRERQLKEKIEKEQEIYQKFLASRIKGSVLKDFHTIRY